MFKSLRVPHPLSRRDSDVRWLVTFKGVWLRGERQHHGPQKGQVLISQSPATLWTSIITVDPAAWAAGLAKDLRKFRKHPKHNKIAVELLQIVSIVPVSRGASALKPALEVILTSTTEKPDKSLLH